MHPPIAEQRLFGGILHKSCKPGFVELNLIKVVLQNVENAADAANTFKEKISQLKRVGNWNGVWMLKFFVEMWMSF